MNTKRIAFWIGFIIILGLILWGLVVAMNKAPSTGSGAGTPAAVGADDHIRGPAKAPVTLIEYSDFQCPACEAYYPLVEKLFTQSSTTLRMVYRHFPLPQHANALLASRASEAASLQGKFWDMYHLLFDNQSSWADLSDTEARKIFSQYATKIGLDMAAYNSSLDSDAVKARIQENVDEGIKIGIDATPTFFVNGKAISNPQSYEQFQALIDAAAAGGAH